MIKKAVLICLCCHFTTKAALDFSQDRPLTTDIPPSPSQTYFKPENRTRACENCPERKNRWAHCNARRLKVKKTD